MKEFSPQQLEPIVSEFWENAEDELNARWKAWKLDLTRNEVDKQGPGGGPITNEAAGGETYNTIMYLVESPHEAGVLWVGSDDGLVHISRICQFFITIRLR